MSSVEAGIDYTRSERSYHLGLITRHESRNALADYQSHSIHVEVAGFVKACSEAAASVDFDERS